MAAWYEPPRRPKKRWHDWLWNMLLLAEAVAFFLILHYNIHA